MLSDVISPTVATMSIPAHHSYSELGTVAAFNTNFINESVFLDMNSNTINTNSSSSSSSLGALTPHDFWFNESGSAVNGTEAAREVEDIVAFVKMIAMSIVLGLMIIITIIGNVFVIAAIILERNLQNVANYLVASLAVADLLVACLVMPLGAVYEISEGWILGPELCDIWTSCDVLCCTASILHLVAIAMDRYWTVTNIDYNNLRTPKRVFFMIFCVWFAAVVVSLAPQFGWKDPEYLQRIEQQKCMVSQDVAYQIFATCCTFYVPLLVILVLYWKIYKIARKRIQRHSKKPAPHAAAGHKKQCDFPAKRKRKPLKICFGNACTTEKNINNINMDTAAGSFGNMREETEFSTSNLAGTELTTISSDADDLRTPITDEIVSTVSHQIAATMHQQHAFAISLSTPRANTLNNLRNQVNSNAQHASLTNPHQKLAKRRQMLEAKRERKAAQTLAIITGAFAACWLPFFVMALLLPLCKDCEINAAVASFFLWLGYFNSTLNPIIYTVFNPEFRRAFKRLLFGRKRLAQCRSEKM